MNKILKIVNFISEAGGYISGVVLMMAAMITTYDVIARTFFNINTPQLLEIAQYSLLFASFIGAAFALKLKAYIRVDFLINKLNLKIQKSIDFVNSIIIAILFLFLSFISYKMTYLYIQKGWTTSTPLKVKMYLLILIITIGTFMVFLQQISEIILDLYRNFIKNNKTFDKA